MALMLHSSGPAYRPEVSPRVIRATTYRKIPPQRNISSHRKNPSYCSNSFPCLALSGSILARSAVAALPLPLLPSAMLLPRKPFHKIPISLAVTFARGNGLCFLIRTGRKLPTRPKPHIIE